MKEYLVFQLHGAMASWGDIAVGDIRPSYRQPSKSAVIGLLAAALGIRREEQEKQQELFKLMFSVKVDNFGTPIEDHHSIQTPFEKTIKNKRVETREDEVFAIKLRIKSENTDESRKQAGAIQSKRTYHCDALYSVALSENTENRINWEAFDDNINKLNDLIGFMEQPRFSLYLGRKSCPLSLPLQAQILSGSNCQEAINKADFDFQEELLKLTKKQKSVAWYSEEPLPNSQMKMTRRDQPVNKMSWQFTEREEYYESEKRGGDVSA